MPYKLGGGGALQVRGVEVPYKLGGGGALQVRGGGGTLQVRGVVVPYKLGGGGAFGFVFVLCVGQCPTTVHSLLICIIAYTLILVVC